MNKHLITQFSIKCKKNLQKIKRTPKPKEMKLIKLQQSCQIKIIRNGKRAEPQQKR